MTVRWRQNTCRRRARQQKLHSNKRIDSGDAILCYVSFCFTAPPRSRIRFGSFHIIPNAAALKPFGLRRYGKLNWPPPPRPWGFTIAFSDGPWGEAAEAAALVYKDLQGPAEPEAARPEEFYEQGSKWSPLYYAENKKSGFYAAALKYDDGTIGIAFRGTSSWTDALVDLLMGFGFKHQQFRDAEEFYEDALTRFGSPRLFVTGHSLGGSLAQYIGAKYKTKAVTFDPYGVSRFVHSPVDDSTARDIVNFTMDFDPCIHSAISLHFW
jgi:hypothetical protein